DDGSQPVVPIVEPVEAVAAEESAPCSGDGGFTTYGLYDLDGDGKPEIVFDPGDGALKVFQLVGEQNGGVVGNVSHSRPEAGRLIAVDNRNGATTKIIYRSAKEDARSPHLIASPEIVATEITTFATGTNNLLTIPIHYAYGQPE